MRTKHILFTMALGAAFVACTSEEDFSIASDNNGTDAMLDIRPAVGSEIVLGGDDAATRLALGTGARPVWGQTDRIGAATIDVPTYSSESDYITKTTTDKKKPIELYNIVEYYGCNNAFTTTDGGNTWTAEHPMVEGNYLFYAPYQEGRSLRSPLEVGIPAKQQATSEKKALEDFYSGNNIVQVGYKFITGSEAQRPSVTLYNIFAYPKFTIVNNFNGNLYDKTSGTPTGTYNSTLHIDSIKFVNMTDGTTPKASTLVTGGKLLHAGEVGNTALSTPAAANDATVETGVVAEMKHKDNGFETNGDWWDLNKMLKEVQTVDLLSADGRKKVGTDGVITTLVVNKDVEQGKSIDLFCVMPAYRFNFDDDQLLAAVYVSINNASYVLYKANLSASTSEYNSTLANGYVFDQAGNNGLSNLTLMAGQSRPAEALRVVEKNGKEDYELKDVILNPNINKLLEIDLGNLNAAVRTTAVNNGIKTTEELIDYIFAYANGTAWEENAASYNTSKSGFTLAPVNTVEINSALIDALATGNQNEGGSFKLMTSVLPISSDVKVTNADDSGITFESVSGKTYKIDLNTTLVESSTGNASGKYAIVNSTTAVGTVDAKTVLIATGGTPSLTVTADMVIKSMYVMEDARLTLSGAETLAVTESIRNDGTLEVVNKLECENIVNNGTMDATNAAAAFTVTGGEGEIVLTAPNAGNNIKVIDDAKQQVIYETSDDIADVIANATRMPVVNAIRTTAASSLTIENWKSLGNIKNVILNDDIALTFSEDGEYNLNGITITVSESKTVTLAGQGLSTSVKGVILNVSKNATITLSDIEASGVAEGEGTINADGYDETWNGSESPVDED